LKGKQAHEIQLLKSCFVVERKRAEGEWEGVAQGLGRRREVVVHTDQIIMVYTFWKSFTHGGNVYFQM